MMEPIPLEDLCADLVDRLGVHPAIVAHVLLATVEHFDAESHSALVRQSGLSPAEYLDIVLTTPRFAATLTAGALMAAGREADARLHWDAYVQREAQAANLAHQGVPASAPLGNPKALHRIGGRLGLSEEETDELIPRIILTIAAGYPFRPIHQRHLSLTDALTQCTAEDLTVMLRHAALSKAGRTEEAAAALRYIPRTHR
jgi:hypothetical protein